MKALFPGASSIIRWHDLLTHQWEKEKLNFQPGKTLKSLIQYQHLCNIRLWHLEDQARRKDVPDRTIAEVKRRIDQENQKRNDAIEKIDAVFISLLEQAGKNFKGELHSETLGSIIDRLSILSLKIYHVREEFMRQDADRAYKKENRKKWQILKVQRRDLGSCYDKLLQQIQKGKKRVKVYYQFKLYNLPQSNPAIYRKEKLRD